MYLLVQRDYIRKDAQILSLDTDITMDIAVPLKFYASQDSSFTSIWKKEEKRTMLHEAIRKILEGEPIWSAENHPELSTPEDIEQYVRNLRISWRISRVNE